MRNLYRSLCLAALLAVAPTVLIGCSGGSSSTNSSSATRANFSYTTPDVPNYLPAVNLRGVVKPQRYIEGSPDLSKGNGVYSFTYNREGGETVLGNSIVINTPQENRILVISRLSANGFDGPVGTVYDVEGSGNGGLYISLSRVYAPDQLPAGESFDIRGGRVRVTAINGDAVTLELEDVVLRPITAGTIEPESIAVSGSFTYNTKNIDRLDFIATAKNSLPSAIGKAAKN